MATADIFLKTSFLSGVAALVRQAIAATGPGPAPDAEDTRARRDYILEMMEAHPEAFASEDSIRGSMIYFSGRF